MSNWYGIIKEANKEAFLIKQRPKDFPEDKWEAAVKWAIDISSKHAVWLTNILRRNSSAFRFGEDDADVIRALQDFETAKNRPEFPHKNINEFKTYPDLIQALEPYRGVQSVRATNKKDIKEGLELLGGSGSYKAYHLSTFEAAHGVSQGTEWCIKNKNNYEGYNDRGPLVYFEKNGEPYACHRLDRAVQ